MSRKYKGAIIINCGRGAGYSQVQRLLKALNTFIKDGVCYNDGSIPCNLGFACDGCPYYKPKKVKEKVVFT